MGIVSEISADPSLVRRNDEQYSTVQTMGNLVNNYGFRKGFVEFQNLCAIALSDDSLMPQEKDSRLSAMQTERSYIWYALSAMAEDLGQTLFSEIQNYIDNVSNVDVCKIHALKSMMKMIGIDYLLLDKVQYYPLEIQKLLDLLSINRKYLFNSRFMEEDFIANLSANGVISDALSAIVSASSNIGPSLSCYKYTAQDVDAYLSSIYKTAILDVMKSQFLNDSSLCYIYKLLVPADGYGEDAVYVDRYIKEKKLNNVDPFFNVEQTVNDIDVGIDNIDNYHDAELELIKQEMYRRQNEEISSGTWQYGNRNLWYRKEKVIEYAKFVDSIANPMDKLQAYSTYRYDRNYIEVSSEITSKYSISGIGTGETGIVEADVDRAAQILVQMTNYIAKIRELIRLQVRKVFMKGTNNLLTYSVNEFMIDYIQQMQSILPLSDFNAIADVIQNLSNHSVEDVMVQEYWDLNEYFNISTDTTKYAINSSLVNSRYFDDMFDDLNGRLVPRIENTFPLTAIDNFYLNHLGLKNTLNLSSDLSTMTENELSDQLHKFLSVIFDVAADGTYRDKVLDGIYGTKLENNIVTHDIAEDLCALIQTSAYIMSIANKAGYVFPTSQIQISATNLSVAAQIQQCEEKLTPVLKEQYLSEVSTLYDIYAPRLEQLSADLDLQRRDLSVGLNETYASYFCKTTSIYAYEDHDPINGSYLFPYFINNDAYHPNGYYEKYMNEAYSFINTPGNCQSNALLCALTELSTGYSTMRSQIQGFVSNMVLSGYVSVDFDVLDDMMDDLQAFVNEKIDNRMQYLRSSLENLRTQASNLKTTYDSLESTFASILANMPDKSQGWYMKYIGPDGGGAYGLQSSSKANKSKDLYDSYSNSWYTAFLKDKNNTFVQQSFSAVVPSEGTLDTRISEAIKSLDEMKNVYYGTSPTSVVSKAHGTSKDALNTLQASLGKLKDQRLSICSQAKALFNISDDKLSSNYTGNTYDILDLINALITFLGSGISEKDFENDTILKSYNTCLSGLIETSATYIQYKSQYEGIWTMFGDFFIDFPKTSDYKTFRPYNLSSAYKYMLQKDAIALQEINNWFSTLCSNYANLTSQFNDICEENIVLYSSKHSSSRYRNNGGVLEECINDLMSKLAYDVVIKEMIGEDNIQRDIDEFEMSVGIIIDANKPFSKEEGLFYKYFPDEFGEFYNMADFEDAIDSSLCSFTDGLMGKLMYHLNYYGNLRYQQSIELFKTYSGIPSIAYDPYYNYKNQTHPSYQIHPFLWNFEEYENAIGAFNSLAKQIASIDYEELESVNVKEAISKLIGEYGNVIDVWKFNINDFSGYQTRYEGSDHVCQYTSKWSEVVDYDGAFYPPALSAYRIKGASTNVSDLSVYYAHLNLDAAQIADINSKFASQWSQISNITDNKSVESEVYDIYRYAVDAYGNMYVLYKMYGNNENITEHDKLMHVGRVFIRLADTPISFPLSAIVEHNSFYESALKNWNIIDMQLMPNGKAVVFTYVLGGITHSQMLYIDYVVEDGKGIGKLELTDHISKFVYGTISKPNDARYAYIGSYNRGNNVIDSVYVSCDNIGNVPDQPIVCIESFNYENPYGTENKIRFDSIQNVREGTLPAASEYTSTYGIQYIDMSFIVDRPDSQNVVKTFAQNLSVDYVDKPYGSTFYDPQHMEMNSFDVFNQSIKRVTLVARSSGIVVNTNNTFQTNTDIGYVPSYAGILSSGPLNIAKDLLSCYQPIELLGKSKNIQKLIDSININPDPYRTKEEIFENFLYGRAYEDYLSNDMSLNIFSNESMFQNMNTAISTKDSFKQSWSWQNNNMFQWKLSSQISEDDNCISAYRKKDLSKLKVMMFATKSLGKNPYIVADLSAISVDMPNDRNLSANYDVCNDYVQSSPVYNIDGYTLVANGTQNGLDQVDYSYSNLIDNIDHIEFGLSSYNSDTLMVFGLYFYLTDPSKPCYIKKDQIKFAFVNEYDLRMFNYLHYLYPGMTYDAILDIVNNEEMLQQALSVIDFDNFSALSNVSINYSGNSIGVLSTNTRFAFKASEEELFPPSNQNYYVPSLNLKYPYTYGQYYKKNFVDVGTNTDKVIQMYSQNEVYVFDVQLSSILSNLGNIIIDAEQNDDCIRVYEDYLSTDSSNNENSFKYLPDDPLFYQFVHFTGTNINEGEINVPDTNVYVQQGGSIDKLSEYLNSHNLSGLSNETYNDGSYGITTVNLKNKLDRTDLADFCEKAKDFLRIYMSYSKTQDGIVLYANYQNYVNSPFVKIEDGRALIDTIDGTYAKIGVGETKILNIMIQFRQYMQQELIGLKNGIVATFQIWNVSDDKPKFVLKKISQATSTAFAQDVSNIKIIADKQTVIYSSGASFDYSVRCIPRSSFNGEISCTMTYPSYAIDLDTYDNAYVVEKGNGVIEMKFTAIHKNNVLQFSTKSNAYHKLNKKLLMEMINVKSSNVDTSLINAENGYVVFKQA